MKSANWVARTLKSLAPGDGFEGAEPHPGGILVAVSHYLGVEEDFDEVIGFG